MNKIFIRTAISLVLASVPFIAMAAFGDTPSGTTGVTPGQFSVQNPLNVTSICGLIKKVLEGVLAIGLPIAALFIMWAGFKFVLAQGNPKELGLARSNFYNVIIGIALFVGAWTIASIIAATVNALSGNNILTCV